jgi:hypothetical protein
MAAEADVGLGNMSIATRYSLLVVGCIIQATFVSVCMNKDGFTLIEHQPILSTPGGLLWHTALWLWPAWIFLLRKYGLRNTWAVILPMLTGLAIMWRVLQELFGFLMMICFPHSFHM